jgi:hypothetical protein
MNMYVRMFCVSSTVNTRVCAGGRACSGVLGIQVRACFQQLWLEVQKDASDTLCDALATSDEQ